LKILIDKLTPPAEVTVIFYTLKGPSYELEIYADKMQLVRKSWMRLFLRAPVVNSWEIDELSQVEISASKFILISGKLNWQTFDGGTGTFRFTTSPAMVKKIELYLQKRVTKNHQTMKVAA
jgi:hypothetical protein